MGWTPHVTSQTRFAPKSAPPCASHRSGKSQASDLQDRRLQNHRAGEQPSPTRQGKQVRRQPRCPCPRRRRFNNFTVSPRRADGWRALHQPRRHRQSASSFDARALRVPQSAPAYSRRANFRSIGNCRNIVEIQRLREGCARPRDRLRDNSCAAWYPRNATSPRSDRSSNQPSVPALRPRAGIAIRRAQASCVHAASTDPNPPSRAARWPQ